MHSVVMSHHCIDINLVCLELSLHNAQKPQALSHASKIENLDSNVSPSTGIFVYRLRGGRRLDQVRKIYLR